MGAHTLGVVDDRRWGLGIRIGNRAVAAFEERMASLGERIGAVAISGRQAAELLTGAAPAAADDHLVASAARDGAVYGPVFGVTARNRNPAG
jgi:O-acetylhomoserine/O-acetylserine sulfhydrylase-like pyridoxal-dependent enzyme